MKPVFPGDKLLCAAGLLLLTLTPLAQVSQQSLNNSLSQDAARAMTAGNLSRAESDLQSVLKTSPNDYRALDLLGVVRILQHRESEAEELFQRALQKKTDFAPAHAHLGLLYAEKGRGQEGVPQLQEALRLDPTRRDAADALVGILRNEARSSVGSGDSEKALALLTEASKYSPDNPDVQLELGTLELQMSLWDDAVLAFERTLTLRNNDPLALYDLGRAFLGEWKFEEARQQFANYVGLRPDDASGHCALGMTLAALERTSEAREQFEKSIALAHDQTESYLRLGLIELNTKELDEAAKNFRQVLASKPTDAGALSALGRVSFEQKHYSEAIELLERAIESDDSLREAHYYLGLTFARLGRKEDSYRQLEIATRLEHEEAEHRRTTLRLSDRQGNDSHSQPQK
jgi:tetratricopeptide (TPR) repeat protein